MNPFQEYALRGDLRQDLPIGAARHANPHGQRGAVPGQPHHADVLVGPERCCMEGTEQLGHFGQLVVGLEATRVGKEPKKRTAEELGLGSDRCSRSDKRRPVCLQPEHRNAAWPQILDLRFELPRALQVEFSRIVQTVADDEENELSSDQLWHSFSQEYLEGNGRFAFVSYELGEGIVAYILDAGEPKTVTGRGNGPVDGFVDAMR